MEIWKIKASPIKVTDYELQMKKQYKSQQTLNQISTPCEVMVECYEGKNGGTKGHNDQAVMTTNLHGSTKLASTLQQHTAVNK